MDSAQNSPGGGPPAPHTPTKNPANPPWLTPAVNNMILRIAYHHGFHFTYLSSGSIRFHEFPAYLTLDPATIANRAIADWAEVLRLNSMLAPAELKPPPGDPGFGLGNKIGELQPQDDVALTLAQAIYSMADMASPSDHLSAVQEMWSRDVLPAHPTDDRPSWSTPTVKIMWARDEFALQTTNNIALEDAYHKKLELRYLYNDWAYFHGHVQNVRLDASSISDPEVAEWVEELYEIGKRVDPASIIRSPSYGYGMAWAPGLLLPTSKGQPHPAVPRFMTIQEALQYAIYDGPRGTFWRFNLLPAELRALIIRHAMQGPGMHYYKIDRDMVATTEPRGNLQINGSCNSSWRWWLRLAKTTPAFAHIVNLAVARAPGKRYFPGGRIPFNNDSDVAAFSLGRSGSWQLLHVRAPPDGVYAHFGHGLRRVAIRYEPENHVCPHPHIHPHEHGAAANPAPAGVAASPWGMVFLAGMRPMCLGACYASMCRYVSFFRDAEVIYILVTLDLQSISEAVRDAFGGAKDTAMQYVSRVLLKSQKGRNLEKWHDSTNTWLEATWETAEMLVTQDAHRPWELADYLVCFIQYAHPGARRKINKRMQFKVLVTTPLLRWDGKTTV